MEVLYNQRIENFETRIFFPHNQIGDENILDFHFMGKRKKWSIERVCYDKQTFLQHYGNPLSLVEKNGIQLLVQTNGDKVSLKLFFSRRSRVAGEAYFIVKKDVFFVTVNKRTGDVYHGFLKNFQSRKKVSKNFSRNNFFQNWFHVMRAGSSSVDKEQFNKFFFQSIECFLRQLGLNEKDLKFDDPRATLVKFYLDGKKIKYPNNYLIYFKDFNSKMKINEIRKSNNKLIDAFMVKNNLKGQVLKSQLHVCESLNLDVLRLAYRLFDESWVNKNPDIILKCLNYPGLRLNTSSNHLSLSLKEKKNLFEIFKLVLLKHIDYYTFDDHLNLLSNLKNLGENVKLRCNDLNSFSQEHMEFTEKIEYYRNGHYERIYPEFIYQIIQEEIKLGGNIYYPILLRNTNDYIRESSVQSNCVKTYIGNPGSYIVSLRKNDKESDDRATIELYLKNNNKNLSINVRQSLGKFNKLLDSNWVEPIDILLKRFSDVLNDGRFELVKIEKTFKFSKKLTSDTYWDENGILRWNSVDITKYV